MKAAVRALDQDEKGISADPLTAMRLLDFGFENMTSYGSELIYEEALERLKQSTEWLD